MLDPAQRASAAQLLWTAERERAPIEPLTDTHPGIDVVDAYEIQLINIRRRLDAGARVVGHKVGLSSPAMQQMMGVDEPDYGHLLDTMVLFAGHSVRVGQVLLPARRGRGRLRARRRPCPVRAAPRTTCWRPPSSWSPSHRVDRQPDRGLADQAGRHHRRQRLLGRRRARRRTAPPDRASDREQRRRRPSTRCSTPATGRWRRGHTSAVLGNPVTAVAWLARKVAAFGVRSGGRATSSSRVRAPVRSTCAPATTFAPSSPGSAR